MKQKGFTLIELLVVIAIIGLLASVVMVALSGARQKARVAKRLADLKQISTALELYYSDNNSYPNDGTAWRGQCAAWGGVPASQVAWDTTLSKGLVPTYITSFPADPSMSASDNKNCYLYISDGKDYKMLDYNIIDMTAAQVSQNSAFLDPDRNGVGATNCPNPPFNGNTEATNALAIWTSGGRCW